LIIQPLFYLRWQIDGSGKVGVVENGVVESGFTQSRIVQPLA